MMFNHHPPARLESPALFISGCITLSGWHKGRARAMPFILRLYFRYIETKWNASSGNDPSRLLREILACSTAEAS